MRGVGPSPDWRGPFGQWRGGAITRNDLVGAGCEGRSAPMLSHTAVTTLAFLRTIPDSAACEDCVAAYIRVGSNAALGSIRELVHASRIAFRYRRCGICQAQRMVALLRRPAVA